jgi:hypothetical protein
MVCHPQKALWKISPHCPSSTLTTVHDHNTPKVDSEIEGNVGLLIGADTEIHLQLWVISAGQIT